MDNKECPSCGMEVPAVAKRCKHCFHDFTEAPPKKGRGLVILLGFVAVMAVLGFGTLWMVHSTRAAEMIVVDAETQSIVITRKTAEATETERIGFDHIARIEHVMGGENAMFEVVAVTTDGDRIIIKQSSDKPLTAHAEHVAAVVGKDLQMVRNIKTFGD